MVILKTNIQVMLLSYYVLFAAWPADCEACNFNATTERAECNRCKSHFGVKDDDKKCAGNSRHM